MKNVEIRIISGFLGSGKTTLLQNILQTEQRKNRKVAVVMNELGQVSIDSDVVPKNTPLKELLNGCVCCTISDKLEVQLSELLHQYDLDVIYIETTGVAHPVDVLNACLSPLIADQIRIHAIITVIDASCWMNRKKWKIPLQKLMTEQIKHADIVVLNKIDCISQEVKKAIENEIRSINQRGRIMPAKFANIDISTITRFEKGERIKHEKVHVLDHLHMKTYVHTFTHPIDKNLFENFLKTMPNNIYRIKGYLRYTESPDTHLFQYSYGMAMDTNAGMTMKNTLVFIGDDINHNQLRETLQIIEEKSLELSKYQ